ncbi:glycogen synthase [Heliorestis acidaminivorans]|uniref:Glycogen synthase n=1 Tax=Heliorestis acidaminivorans TaxID=553427 RepID=A0A6I0F1X9_9FIRM|nr:glycogen synthase [Heliorestis acidaminivorans]KAB2953318.1 glycogen synthase [Heliorestis acidaminivorans]
MSAQPLKVLYVSTEVEPYAKTGGLADVAGSLPRALASAGMDIAIVMPSYKFIAEGTYVTDFPVPIQNRMETAIIRQSSIKATSDPNDSVEVPVFFIDNHHYFYRDNIYGYADDGDRWGFFSRALLELIKHIDFYPDVLHFNDWQAGPAAAMLKEEYQNKEGYKSIASVLTVHNLKYQGIFGRPMLDFLGLSDSLFDPEKMEFYGQINFLKGGIVYADLVNTVSPTYAEEIKTEAYGEQLDGLLRKREAHLFGILNGINTDQYNPGTDPYLSHHFSAEYVEGKKQVKADLQKELGLPVNNAPLLGLVSRLVDQKGLDLIGHIAHDILQKGAQLVVVGEGDPFYENMFRQFEQDYPEQVRAFIGFNKSLAQRVYGASDFFLMPSRYEPCGLGQMIAFRYGSIPIVRATGGLADTVFDYDQDAEKGNGFVFHNYEAAELLDAVNRSLRLYENKQDWNKLVRHVMTLDFSWERSAKDYMAFYRRALQKVGRQ